MFCLKKTLSYHNRYRKWCQTVSGLVLLHANRWRHAVACTMRVSSELHEAVCRGSRMWLPCKLWNLWPCVWRSLRFLSCTGNWNKEQMWNFGKSATKALNMIGKAYSDEAKVHTQCFEWDSSKADNRAAAQPKACSLIFLLMHQGFVSQG